MEPTTIIDGVGMLPEMPIVTLPTVDGSPNQGVRQSGRGDARDTGPVSVRRPVIQFLLSCLLALIVAGAFTFFASRNVAADIALGDVRRVASVSAEMRVRPELTDALVRGDPQALQEIDKIVREEVLNSALVRVKVWEPDGTIIYSDEPRLIGMQFPLSGDERAIFDGAEPAVSVSDLSKPENQFETGPKLLEVYLATSTREGTPLLFEAYFRYARVTAISRQLWGRFAPIALGSLIFIELVQIPLVWRLARRLRVGQEHRERLLSHAIESSNSERRRIAGDLHDGVVQELTGQWLTLAAAARSSPDAHPQLQASSERIRQSVMSLRSLLVDIYPPNLFEEGLEAALDDLVRPLETRGINPTLTVDSGVGDLPPNTTGLIYRAAQEALRNVVAHASATTVFVHVARGDSVATLVVEDNGRGFPDDASRADGHFGLRALADLIGDSGGRMVVRSAPGVGSSVLVAIPTELYRRKGAAARVIE